MLRQSLMQLGVGIGVLASCYPAWALDYLGRFSLGSFISHEEHEPEPNGTDTNDFATGSARFYYRASQFWGGNHFLTTDFRDKNDFFNKLDKEKQELTENNSFQARQVSIRREPLANGLVYEAGRYPVPNAGAVFNDGASLGYRFSPSWVIEGFYGLNPKSADKGYLEYNPDATNYGGYIALIPESNTWIKRSELFLAHVTQKFRAETDRQYIYEQGVYQWSANSLLSSFVYYDFVPRAYVQNGQLSWHQGWLESVRTIISATQLDVIEYRRVQDLRETLTPSAYSETSAKLILQFTPSNRISVTGRSGEREIDKLKREQTLFEWSLPRSFSQRIDFALRASQKKEFTKTGQYAGFFIGRYSDVNEIDLEIEAGNEKQTDHTSLHPIRVETNYSYQWSRRFFTTLGLQSESDEKVKIYSAFFKLTYRFGNKETSPIRDGAAPRGRL